eukprot:1053045-Amphidinium_carterae.1
MTSNTVITSHDHFDSTFKSFHSPVSKRAHCRRRSSATRQWHSARSATGKAITHSTWGSHVHHG